MDAYWDAATVPNDEFLAPAGRVMEKVRNWKWPGAASAKNIFQRAFLFRRLGRIV
jgi:hypothetical protein